MQYSINEIVKSTHSPFPAERFAQARILVVDDMEVNVKLICEFLKAAGFQNLSTASDGIKALKETYHFSPDLVLLDIMMPQLDGYGYCERIRSDPGATRMPIIVQTALGDREARLRALSCGADDFLNKPLDPEEMILRVVVHLERHFMFHDMDQMRIKLHLELEQTKHAMQQMEQGKLRPSPRTILSKHYETLSSLTGDSGAGAAAH